MLGLLSYKCDRVGEPGVGSYNLSLFIGQEFERAGVAPRILNVKFYNVQDCLIK